MDQILLAFFPDFLDFFRQYTFSLTELFHCSVTNNNVLVEENEKVSDGRKTATSTEQIFCEFN